MNNPRPSSTHVMQNTRTSSSSSSSSRVSDSAGRRLLHLAKSLASSASSIVNVTQRMVMEIKADVVPRAVVSSGVLASCAG